MPNAKHWGLDGSSRLCLPEVQAEIWLGVNPVPSRVHERFRGHVYFSFLHLLNYKGVA